MILITENEWLFGKGSFPYRVQLVARIPFYWDGSTYDTAKPNPVVHYQTYNGTSTLDLAPD